ncbi:PEP-CTERM system TPR-repeat protein PrsT [Colwellia sp. KU-HH00111]|uniref:XrtA/PEP-CTERM system TPR-repeat protein PrsT n=1 Tax=Colwellia sp. KU-HH00111 TaxID=3127652 RepID=UPI003105EB26
MTRALKISLLLFTFFTSYTLQANEAYEDALKSFHKQAYNETIIHLKNALKADIDHIPSRILLVETLVAQGQGEMAETELYDLQGRGVDFNQIVALLAQSLILQDKYREVLDVATSGYRGNDIESRILFSRGQAHLGLNQLRQAEQAFSEALAMQSDFQLAMLGIAQVAINQNDLAKANKFVDQALLSYEPLINAWIMKATLYQIQGQFEKALSILNDMVERDGEHLQVRLNRATLYITNEKWAEAAQDLDLILAKIPLEPRAKYLRAIVSAQLGDNEDSKNKINETIVTLNSISDEVMKQNPSYLFLAGVTNYNLGNFEDALRYFQYYLTIKENDFGSLRYIAIIELKQGNPQNAKNLLSKANVYYPDDPALLSLLGISLMELGKIEQAKYYFEKVVSLTPGYGSALSNLAQSEILAGNYSQAISNLLDAKKSDDNSPNITLLLVEAYLKTNQFDKAKELTQKLVNAQPQNSYFQKQHGIALGLSGDIEKARAAFLEAVKLQPENSDAIIHLARMEFIAQGPESAIALLKSKVELQPKNTKLIVELADLYLKIGQMDKALAQYQQAFDFDNQNVFTLTKLVDYFFITKKYSKAEPILLAYLQKHPKDSKIKIKLGHLYGKLNKPLKAIDTFKSAVNESADRTKTYMLLAQAQLKIDNRDGAIRSLNKATAWDEKRIEPLLMLFPIALSQKDYARAEQVIYTINKLIPEQDVVDILNAQLFEAQKQLTKAEQYYRKALKKNQSKQSTYGLFNVLNKQRMYTKSQTLIKEWLSKNPDDVVAEISLAESYALQDNLSKSLTSYQGLIEKFQRMPILLNNAANIALRLGDKGLAAEYANEAYKKAPNNPSIIDTFAWINTQLGKRSEAISLFRQALVLDFDNAEVKYHLAVTLKAEQRDREAYKLLTEAVKAEQEFSDKALAKELLKQWRLEN